MYTRFINIGDTFKAEQETFSTHRGLNYVVSHVFNDKGKFRVFVADKYGKDVEVVTDFEFTPTAKTVTASNERQRIAKLDYLWNNPRTKFVINSTTYHSDDKKVVEFNKYSIGSATYSGPQADIYLTLKGYKVEGSEAVIRKPEDLYAYFKGVNVEKLTHDGVFYTNQQDIDHVQYMLTIPHYDESLLNLPESKRLVSVDHYVHREKPDLEAFLKICAEVIFDEPELSAENKLIVRNIIEAYELLPKSFGPTGCAKLMMGKEKKQNKNVEHLSGTCTKFKQPQMFELCNIVESFMYVSKIFVKTDDYSSGDEWRGAYEFIGSKAINKVEIAAVKRLLS